MKKGEVWILDFMNLFSGKQADYLRTAINQHHQK
jgi:hypothetical protein